MSAITDHPDFVALMRTVIAHPDADLPRLVLADWLEGDAPTPDAEFAEFIRLQCELESKLVNHSGSANRRIAANCSDPTCRGCQMQDREQLLWSEFAREWFGDTALWMGHEDCTRGAEHAPHLIARRGFIDEIRAPAAWVWGGVCEHAAEWVEDEDEQERLFDAARRQCRHCHGEGRTPAHGYEVIRRWPVTKVVVVGVRPDEEPQGDGSARWLWWRGRHVGPHHLAGNIPPPVYDRIAFARYGGSLATTGIGRPHADFPTAALALDALSAGIIADARDTTQEKCDE